MTARTQTFEVSSTTFKSTLDRLELWTRLAVIDIVLAAVGTFCSKEI